MAHLRLVAPFRQLNIRLINGIQDGQVVLDPIRESDIVVIQREFPRMFGDYQKVILTAKQEGKPLIFDLDDLLFFLPENHPDRQAHSFATSLLPMLQALLEADIVTVSTPKLQDMLQDYNENIVVLPNYLDDGLWSLQPPVLKDSSSEAIVIGYMGTKSHAPDLEYITPVLVRILERYPQEIKFHCWGPKPPVKLLSLPQVKWTPFVSHSYTEFALYFQAQSADIFIAPLLDNPFNRCKSPIKFLEYSALGVCGVYSQLEPYEHLVEHGRNGLMASTLAEWEECLVQLIEDVDFRYRLAVQAQKTTAEEWLLSRNISHWSENLHRMLGQVTGEQRHAPLLTMLRSINIQATESFQVLADRLAKQEQRIHTLTMQKIEQDRRIQEQDRRIQEQEQRIETLVAQKTELETEILGYVLSRSWRMTRPFRKIEKKLDRVQKHA